MKSKFKIILLTMFFICSFGVIAYADTPVFSPPGDKPYYFIYKINSSGEYYCYASSKPFVSINRSICTKPDSFTFIYSYNGSTWKTDSCNSKLSYSFGSSETLLKTSHDILTEDGKVFFQQPRAPHWTDKVTLGGMITQVRPVAIVAGGFLVLLIALRKGFSLLRTVLKGL